MRDRKLRTYLGVIAAMAFCTAGLARSAELDGFPGVRPDLAKRIAPGVTVIPDPRINYVPNIGVIEGEDAVLVVDTGLGPQNGKRVWEYVRNLAGRRAVFLTATHFHPEHSFGAQAFDSDVTFILNEAQAKELIEKGSSYLDLFRSFGPHVAAALAGTSFIAPDETYASERALDLGNRKVILRAMPAHTRGDQIVYVPDSGVVFLGDLVESRFFPIFPDADSRGSQWIQVTKSIEAIGPKIVVPGHGEVSDASLIREVREYLETVKTLVGAGVAAGRSQEEVARDLAPKLTALHPTWDNAVFIPYAIAIFYSEATGKSVQLPDLSTELKTQQ